MVGAPSTASLVLSQVGVSAEQSVVGSWSRVTRVLRTSVPELPAGAARPREGPAGDTLQRRAWSSGEKVAQRVSHRSEGRPLHPLGLKNERPVVPLPRSPQGCSQLTGDRDGAERDRAVRAPRGLWAGVLQGLCVSGDGQLARQDCSHDPREDRLAGKWFI